MRHTLLRVFAFTLMGFAGLSLAKADLPGIESSNVQLSELERATYLTILKNFDRQREINFLMTRLLESEDPAVVARAQAFRRTVRQRPLDTKMLVMGWLGLNDPRTVNELMELVDQHISLANFALSHLLPLESMMGQADLAALAIQRSGGTELTDNFLQQPGWESYPEVWQAALSRHHLQTTVLMRGAFREAHWFSQLPEIISFTIDNLRGQSAHEQHVSERILSSIVDLLANHMNRNTELGRHPENPIYFNKPLLKWLIDSSEFTASQIIEKILVHPHFADSGLIEYAIRFAEAPVAASVAQHVLSQPHMINNSNYFDLALGQEFRSLDGSLEAQQSFSFPADEQVQSVMTSGMSPQVLAAALTNPDLQEAFFNTAAQEQVFEEMNQARAEERRPLHPLGRALADGVLPVTQDPEMALRLFSDSRAAPEVVRPIANLGEPWMLENVPLVAAIMRTWYAESISSRVANRSQYQNMPGMMMLGLNHSNASVVADFIEIFLGSELGAQHPELLLSAVQRGMNFMQEGDRRRVQRAVNQVVRRAAWQNSALATQVTQGQGRLTHARLVEHVRQNPAPRLYCSSLFL